MNPRKITQRITALALLASASYLLSITGCSSASNPSPGGPDATTHDGSNGTAGSGGSAGGGGSSGAGGASGSGGSAGAGGSDGSGGDAGNDTGIPDTGACKSDSSTCNSCYTDADIAKDPLNGCSAYTKNCVPFSGIVPTHPAIP